MTILDYNRIYNAIIDRGKSRVLNGYSESHHIVPKCMGGDDSESNLVRLTASEHYLCHQLLAKMYPEHPGLVFAAVKMTFGQHRITNKLYSWLKSKHSSYMRGPNNPQRLNPRCGERHHYHNKHRGDKYTDEGRKKQSDRMKAQNPTHGVKPWCHNKATDYTRSVWLEADTLYTLWIANGHPSYSRLYNLHTGAPQRGRPGVISPYMNVYKYFKAGWIPTDDVEWSAFKEQVSEQHKPI